MSSSNRCHNLIKTLIPRNATVIEIGHGYGYTGLRLRHSNPTIKKLVGVDTYKPYCDTVKKLGIYNEIQNIDAKNLSIYPDNSFTTGLAVHVIEHDADGDTILEELERVSTCRVIVATPDGVQWKDEDPRDGNTASIHRRGYDAQYFQEKGYKVKYVPRSRSKLITAIKNIALFLADFDGRHRDIVAWKDCIYMDADAVICNEEPWNCPRRRTQ